MTTSNHHKSYANDLTVTSLTKTSVKIRKTPVDYLSKSAVC